MARIKRHNALAVVEQKVPQYFVTALLGGLLVGALGWTLQQHRHRQALFHARPFRRLAALGYLRAHPSVDSARVLHDYLRWESHPLLRRRARLVLRRMERILRS